MIVLGIETSCDETALALVDEGRCLASVMSSQVDIHALFGGVVPELASREHSRLIGPLLDLLIAYSGLAERFWLSIGAVAVSRGPGLLGSLLVGVSFAKALALGRALPLIGVNHLEAHLLVAALESELLFPALGVLVSGGHTNLYRIDNPLDFQPLGRTLDDAAGEAFDKFAKLAGLPYPGGVLLDALAGRGDRLAVEFPRPYTKNDNLDFSFSGLKTAGAAWLAEHPEARFPQGAAPARDRLEQAPQILCDVAASYMLAVADTLKIKARMAHSRFGPACIVLAGGVAASMVVRRAMGELAAELGLPLFIPSPKLCTDNGVMVAWTGLLQAKAGRFHGLDLTAVPRGQAILADYLQTSGVSSAS